MQDAGVGVSISATQRISVAYFQNEVPLLQEITVENLGREPYQHVELRLSAEPPFCVPTTIRLDQLSPGASRRIAPVDLALDPGFLRQLTEGMRGSLTAKVIFGDRVVGEERVEVELLPPSHWGGAAVAPELLAAFVRPNDPSIDVVLHDASSKLGAAGRERAIDGYKSGSRERAWELASAIWSALAGHGLSYVLPPASFEVTGQKVRSPSDVLVRGAATCLDLSLLFAACLEQAGLNPVVVLSRGHAFVGLWLKPENFASVAIEDMQTLRKRRDLEDIIFIETTLLTHARPAPFSAAVRQGATQVEDVAAPLEVAIDIGRARTRHIRPLDLGRDSTSSLEGRLDRPSLSGSADTKVEQPPRFASEIIVDDSEEPALDRLERWKRRLLDLSLRNRLLNFKDSRKAVPIDCPDPARLENLLARNQRFKLLPRADVLSEEDGRDARLYTNRHHDDGRRSYLLSAVERMELHTTLAEGELSSRLVEMFRTTRTAFEEGGSNILFLAMGFLSWTPKDEPESQYRAPLLLVPVSLQRSSARAGFRLLLHDDDVMVNPTLLEMLRLDFGVVIPEFDGELPSNDVGIDVTYILRLMRAHVKDMAGWEVSPDVVLSTFSFTKFLMWRDLVARSELLKHNPMVRHLIETPTKSFGDRVPFPSPELIDREYHPGAIFAPLSADSSQLSAVLAASIGKDFVLFGPPGTGKSQTIANIISQTLAHGKTVLFVSQKTAALEVVQRRLREIGLGEYCLEVHSAKSQRSAVLHQLKQSWHERTRPPADDWTDATGELAKLRDQLNALVSALHRPRSNGMTAHEAIGRVIADRNRLAELKFDFDRAGQGPEHLAELQAICHDMAATLAAVGDPAAHPLRGLDVTQWDPTWRQRTKYALTTFTAALRTLAAEIGVVADLLGVTRPANHDAARALLNFGRILIEPLGDRGQLFLGERAGLLHAALVAFSEGQKQAARVRESLLAEYRFGVFSLDLDELLADWTDANQAGFLSRGSRQRRLRSQLQPFAVSELPDDLGPDLVSLRELRDIIVQLRPQAEILAPLFADWRGIDTDLARLTRHVEWAKRISATFPAMAAAFGFTSREVRSLAVRLRKDFADMFADDGALMRHFPAADAAWTSLTKAEAMLAGLVESSEIVADGEGAQSWEAATIERMQRWDASLDSSQAWLQWTAIARRARDAGLAPLVDALEAGTVSPAEAPEAFATGYARWWSEVVIEEDATLRSFLAARHENLIVRYRSADEHVAELSKRIVRARLSGNIPAPNASGAEPEWGILAREVQKRSKHQSLRQLFGAIPNVLTRLTPCVMMSPLSIAQYLPANSKPFDLVIFDEASQIPVWDAIGAMGRASQVIIVGDPEQLPPTSVAERTFGGDDADTGEDQESILDEALACNVPTQRLDWHYRSRRESLIAFSNHAYYGGQLVTFPSPLTDDRAITFGYVENGVYERGTSRTNREEARAVVEELVRRLREPRFARERLSMGIVAFNAEQMQLIENLIDQERRNFPAIEPYFSKDQWHEPVFVKNLENVQGDERDIILFSCAVGPDATGRITSTVSSLNHDGGHRRLNVAITRARKELAVFASLRPEQIDVSRTDSRALRDFKRFLQYAERGMHAIGEVFEDTEVPPYSAFEEGVRAALETRGWTVHQNVGVSKFRIDLAIVDPDEPSEYLAAIECDGNNYAQAASARDRDRLRDDVLLSLGWKIYRAWSLDWWMNFDAALDKLDSALKTDLRQVRADRNARRAQQAVAHRAREEAEAALMAQLQADEQVTDAQGTEAVAHLDLKLDLSDFLQEAAKTLPSAPDQAAVAEAEEDIEPISEAEPEAAPPPQKGKAVEREPERLMYADAVAPKPADPPIPMRPMRHPTYALADLSNDALLPRPEQFYDSDYRPQLRAIIAQIVAAEGPIYEDWLVQRLARLHGFARAGSSVRQAITAAAMKVTDATLDDDRQLLWPLDANTDALVPFRKADAETRPLQQIPLVELAYLAASVARGTRSRTEVIGRMVEQLGFASLPQTGEARLQKACELAGLR